MSASCHAPDRQLRLHRLSAIAAVLVASLFGLAGCTHLPDQRTFDRHAGEPPLPPRRPPPAAPRPVPPLVSIPDTASADDYLPPLRDAVARALARKPNVLFDIRATVPGGGGVDAAAARAQVEAAGRLKEIAQAAVAAGAGPTQVQIGVETDPQGHGHGSIEVFVH